MVHISGKCPPEPEELEHASECFDSVELYLTRKHVNPENIEKSLQICLNADVEITSVHTPHVNVFEVGFFERADYLAHKLDAYLVVHSMHVGLERNHELIEKVEFKSRHGFENGKMHSPYFIEHSTLEQGHGFVLDIGHLSVADRDYVSTLRRFLKEYSS